MWWQVSFFMSIFSTLFSCFCMAGLVLNKLLYLFVWKRFHYSFVYKAQFEWIWNSCLDFFFFSLRMLKIGPLSLLACKFSAKRSVVSLLGFFLKITCHFSLADFKIDSFALTSDTLMAICFGDGHLASISQGSLNFLNVYVRLCSDTERFLCTIFSQICFPSCLFFLLLFQVSQCVFVWFLYIIPFFVEVLFI